MNTQLREVARTVHRSIFPTSRIQLLGRTYEIVAEGRSSELQRDYPLLQALARDKHCILDVGANLGITALIMSPMLQPGGSLHAFEASEKACLLIKENVRLNDLSGCVQVVNAVLAERSGMTLDFYWDHASGGASLIFGYLSHTRPLQKVTLALDDFVAEKSLRPDLIKIDVEGAERQVLMGMHRLMQESRPEVIIELHSWDGMTITDNAAAVLELLSSVGYRMVYLKTKEVVRDLSVFAERGRCHVLLLPTEQGFPEWLTRFETSDL